jgi:hypothetical protein
VTECQNPEHRLGDNSALAAAASNSRAHAVKPGLDLRLTAKPGQRAEQPQEYILASIVEVCGNDSQAQQKRSRYRIQLAMKTTPGQTFTRKTPAHERGLRPGLGVGQGLGI